MTYTTQLQENLKLKEELLSLKAEEIVDLDDDFENTTPTIVKDVDMSNHISKEVVNVYDTIYKQNNHFYNGTKKLKCKERDYHKGVLLEDNTVSTELSFQFDLLDSVQNTINNLKPFTIIEGFIKKITPNIVFVDLFGYDATCRNKKFNSEIKENQNYWFVVKSVNKNKIEVDFLLDTDFDTDVLDEVLVFNYNKDKNSIYPTYEKNSPHDWRSARDLVNYYNLPSGNYYITNNEIFKMPNYFDYLVNGEMTMEAMWNYTIDTKTVLGIKDSYFYIHTERVNDRTQTSYHSLNHKTAFFDETPEYKIEVSQEEFEKNKRNPNFDVIIEDGKYYKTGFFYKFSGYYNTVFNSTTTNPKKEIISFYQEKLQNINFDKFLI